MKKIFAVLLVCITILLSACEVKMEEENKNGAFEYAVYGVGIGEMLQLDWIGLDEDAPIQFTSSDISIAVINSYGAVTGKSEGRVTITAKLNKMQFTCIVEVNNGEYSNLTGEETFIKWEGRNFVYNDMVNCFNTASGFEAMFYGTSFSAEIAAGASDSSEILCVMIDDLHSPMDNVLKLNTDKKVNSYVLAKNLSEGFHKIRVYKITEARYSSVAFKSFKTDGYFWARPNDKKYKLEFYGDSITVGLSNMRDQEQEVPSPQNGCMTYGWLAAEQIGADVNIFARSGIGMNWSWGDEIYMKDQYKYTYCSKYNFLNLETNPLWNFKSYVPDIVVVNVGTNDTWCDTGYDEQAYIESMRELSQSIIDEYGTQIKILFCGGVMTPDNTSVLITLAEEIENAYYLELPYTGGHPNKKQHLEIAEVLVDKLEEILA